MLSVCIPVYNFNITPLHAALLKQSNEIDENIEIVIIDDASSIEFREINKGSFKKSKFLQLKKNVGRSKIRNLFLEEAQYDNLLFLDCDSIVHDANFLNNYLTALKQFDNSIFYGGRVYPSNNPERNQLLRWEYGHKRESKNFEQRIKIGNKALLTNNFLIKRALLVENPFDENLSKYGHEDTLFGFELNQKHVQVQHINNPVVNGEIETNTEYLAKTIDGLQNLVYILNKIEDKTSFINYVTVLKKLQSLNRLKLTAIFRFSFLISKSILKYTLKKGIYGNLLVFNIYKLGILVDFLKKQNN